jgi:hypothetical protein
MLNRLIKKKNLPIIRLKVVKYTHKWLIFILNRYSVIQYDGRSLGISKSGIPTYYYYPVRRPKRGRTNFHYHYLNNKFIYLYNKNFVFLYVMSNKY